MTMRLRLHLVLACVLLHAISLHAQAQDPAKIVDQYIKALGGAKTVSRIQSLTLEGTVAGAADDSSGTYTLSTKLPNRYYSELHLGGHHYIEAYNGKSAWHQDASGQFSTLLGPEALQLEAAALFYNSHLLHAKKDRLGLALAGHAEVRGRDALQVEVTSPSGVSRFAYFDAQSHLLVREIAQVGGDLFDIYYGDYRPERGIVLPHEIEMHRGPAIYRILITRAAINEPVGERVFDFPRKLQVQLPDLKTMFEEIDKNQKAIDKIKEDYSGKRVEEETEYDGNGKVKKREVSEYQFFYLDGSEFSTLIKKNGKPLSDDEQKKANDAVQKRIQEHQKAKAEKEAKEQKDKEQGKSSKDADKDDPSIEVFLRACQFVNPRRERFRGEDVLVFDFEPNPDFKPHTLAEKVVQKLAGVVWIAEKAHDVARLEAYFVGDFRFAGGLLINLQKGTNFIFEQAFINSEVWLPTYEEAHVGVRLLLVKGFRVGEVTRYSDYQKSHIESLSTIAPPKPQ
jgi:hypothetical protein